MAHTLGARGDIGLARVVEEDAAYQTWTFVVTEFGSWRGRSLARGAGRMGADLGRAIARHLPSLFDTASIIPCLTGIGGTLPDARSRQF